MRSFIIAFTITSLFLGTTAACTEPGTYPGSPQLPSADTESPAKDPSVYLFAVFKDNGKIIDGRIYNKKWFYTKAECEDFIKTGGGTDPAERRMFAESVMQLRSVVQDFIVDHPHGSLGLVCATDKDRPVKGEDI